MYATGISATCVNSAERDADKLRDLLLVVQVIRRPGAAEAPRPRRQLKAPAGLDDGAVERRQIGRAGALRPPGDAGDHQHRHLVQVRGEMPRGGADRCLVRPRLGRRAAVGERAPGAPVVPGDGGAGVGIRDDHEVPRLRVRRRRRLYREPDALLQQLPRHGTRQVEAALHRPRRREQLVGRQIQDRHARTIGAPACGVRLAATGRGRPVRQRLRTTKAPHRRGSQKAPRVGFEPTTLRLTVGCSAVELPRNG